MSSDERARALSRELVEVHNWLRGELRRVTDEVDNYTGSRPVDLRAHCLAFCTALTRHHTREDDIAFPALAQRFPELAPVLQGLSDDHRLVADILLRLRELLADLGAGDLPHIKDEIAGLTAILESHFRWEERRIATAFDQLPIGGHSNTELFGVSA